MNKVRLFFKSIVLTTLALSTSLQAGISPLAFNGVFECFKREYKMYAPNLGCAALQNGLVNNLRFCMVNPGKDAHRNRLWIEDKAPANDPVAALAILLFPSPAGSLTAVTSHPDNIGRHLTVEHVAQLLNFCAHVRKTIQLMDGNRFGKNAVKCIGRLIAAANKKLKTHAENYFSKFFEIQAYSANTVAMNTLRSLLKHTQQGRELLTALCKVIEFEERCENLDAQFYPKFQAEQLLNAFFCLKFGQEDIPTLLANLDDSIVDHEILPEGHLIDQSDLESVAQKQPDKINLDDLWAIQNRDLVDQIIPYARGSKPVNNGLALAYDRSNDHLTQIEFPDCTETFIRHLSNLVLYSNKRKNFDLTLAKKRLNNSLLLKNLKDFYQVQTPDKANSGEQSVRNAFCKVVGGLGHPVRYRKKSTDKAAHNDAEVDSGIINIIRVLNIIYNLELDAEPVYHNDRQFADNVTQWAQVSLEKMFKFLDPQKKVDIDIANFVAFKAFGGYEHDCQGKIKIKVNEDFAFTMSIQSNHAQFDSIDILVPEKQMITADLLENVMGKFKPTLQNNIGESLFLLNEQTQEIIQNQLYSLFRNSVDDSRQIIQLLDRLLVITQEHKISIDHAAIILKNCLQMFLWHDYEMSKQIQPTIQNWTKLALQEKLLQLLNVLQDEVKVVHYNGLVELFNHSADDLLIFFRQAKALYLNANNKLTTLIFAKNHSSLKRINLEKSSIQKVEISADTCPNLKTLTLSGTQKLQSLNLSGTFQLLETINLSQSSIQKVDISAECPKLKTLTVSWTEQLQSLNLSGIFQLLETISLFRSSIQNVKFSAECPRLKTLALSETQQLQSLNLSGTFQLLETINLSQSSIQKVELAAQCPNLTTLTLSRTQQLQSLNLSGFFQLLETINLNESGIKKVEISADTCPSLKTLTLSGTQKLKDLNFSGTFQLLEIINLFRSSIKNIEVSNHTYPSLKILDLSWTEKLQSLNMSGIFQLLETINLKSSDIENIKICAECPSLKTLDLSWTEQLQSLNMSGIFQLLETINLDESGIQSIEIPANTCPNLKLHDSRIKFTAPDSETGNKRVRDNQTQNQIPAAKKPCSKDLRDDKNN